MKFFLDNWILFAVAFSSGAMLLYPLVSRSTGGARITVAQAVQLINRERAVLIDVSEPKEYAAGHAAGAKSIPIGGLESSGDLPKNKSLPVVLMCPTGARASRAVAALKKLGFEKTHVLAGGLAAWREANLPIEKTAA